MGHFVSSPSEREKREWRKEKGEIKETNLSACESHYTELKGSIKQRLRWVVGANLSLNLDLEGRNKGV